MFAWCRGPREAGFMADRQQSPASPVVVGSLGPTSLVVVGSLGHVCLTDKDCTTKDAVCRLSGTLFQLREN